MPKHSALRAGLLAAAACAVMVGGSASASAAPTSPPAPAPQVGQVGSAAQSGSIVDDVASAERTVNGFWSAHWSEHFTGTYLPPSVLSTQYGYGIYDGEQGPAYCGSEPVGPGNAFYCPSGDFLAFDASLLDRSIDLGDGFLYMVVAHEWGHAIQARLSEDAQLASGELQADCFAGAAVYGAVADGTLVWEEGDSQEVSDGLSAVADELPWGDSDDHGDAYERVDSFNRGAIGGVEACLPSAP